MNPVLQWFTGNIGLHHVHHLGPRIPNYNLQRCHDENEMFHDVTVLTVASAIKTMRLKVWDEEAKRLVPIRELEARARLLEANRAV
jgi:omega-6 fatty acid desaturase (delta-12 desaturase)